MQVKRPSSIHAEVVLTGQQQVIYDYKTKLTTVKRAPEGPAFGPLAMDGTFVPERAMVSYCFVGLICTIFSSYEPFWPNLIVTLQHLSASSIVFMLCDEKEWPFFLNFAQN